MITIQNLTRRMLPLNVPELGTDAGTVAVSHRDAVSGQRGILEREREHPKSITLMAKGTKGDTSYELPDSVEDSPEVKNAFRAVPAQIKITRIAAPTVQHPEPTPPTQATPDLPPELVVSISAPALDKPSRRMSPTVSAPVVTEKDR